jgi:phosphoribosylaminoimidazole-succinocarboxamide synthase
LSDFKYAPSVPGLTCIHQGKVRDTYSIPDHPEFLLVVATDRVSTHNIVHESVIPKKGFALTAITVAWMQFGLQGIKTHLVASRKNIYDFLPEQSYPEDLEHRAIVVKKLTMIPVEFIFRSRMAGSLWKDYYQKGVPNPYGLKLPGGLELMSPFEDTIFTPTDKSETDDPLLADEVKARYPAAYELALKVYETGRAEAAQHGIEIIDGKFEIGIDSKGEPVLGDECLTPDSCRFVRRGVVQVGKEPPWLDKQYLREEAERMWAGGKKTPLTFSSDVTAETTTRYTEIVNALCEAPLL